MQKHYLGPRKKEIYQYFTIYVSFIHNSPLLWYSILFLIRTIQISKKAHE